jgi:HD-GYP domain-containing protein (c-di-GMP phosphodiesterase class II)
MVRLADAIRAYDEKSTSENKGGLFRARDATRTLNNLTTEQDDTVSHKKTVTPPVFVDPEKIYKQLIGYMKEVGRTVRKGDRFDTQKGEILLHGIIRNAKEILTELHRFALLSAGDNKYSLCTHAANVSINAIIMGIGLGYSKQRLLELGTAALFHDIGMYKVSDAIRKKKGKLTPSEGKLVRKHVELSFKELLKCGEEYRWAADIVYQEHERADGSGYPRGLKGLEISEYASIIGIVDVYESLIHKGLHSRKLLPSYAMKEIIRNSKGLFPTPIIKNLVNQLSMFPVKSYVRLNNGSIGMVVRANSLWPLKPVVSLIYDAQGRKESGGRTVDLSENRLLYIKDVISEGDIPDLC